MVESREEIMADKLVSLVDCPYLRHRDIWDLHWLHSQGADVNLELIASKLADYNVIDYAGKVDSMIARLPEIVRGKDFTDQMSRFIPLQIHERTLLKEKFQVVLAQDVAVLLTKATSAVS